MRSLAEELEEIQEESIKMRREREGEEMRALTALIIILCFVSGVSAATDERDLIFGAIGSYKLMSYIEGFNGCLETAIENSILVSEQRELIEIYNMNVDTRNSLVDQTNEMMRLVFGEVPEDLIVYPMEYYREGTRVEW